MRILILGGEPASGKTTLIKRWINIHGGIDQFIYRKELLVTLHTHTNGKLAVFGDFRQWNKTFGSTDKWSMAVEPVLKAWIKINRNQEITLIGEGDRICTKGVIEACRDYLGEENYKVAFLKTEQARLAQRHINRRDSQTEKFLKGRATKYSNLMNQFNGIEIWENNTVNCLERNLEKIESWVKQ